MIKFWEIKRGEARVDVYAADIYDDAIYIAVGEESGSLLLCNELENAERVNRPGVVDYRDARGDYGNEYPDAKAAVEYLLENKLIEVDEAKYVGPEHDSTLPARCDELVF